MTKNLISVALNRRPEPLPEVAPPRVKVAPVARQASRIGQKAITVYHPEIVHRTLKILAAEEGRTIEDLTAEALNLLFAHYGKPEVARGSDAI